GLIRQNPVVRWLSVVGAQRVNCSSVGRVEYVDLEAAVGAGLHRNENGVGGCDQWGAIMGEGPRVVQGDRGRPMDGVHVLGRRAIVGCVLRVPAEGRLCLRGTDE